MKENKILNRLKSTGSAYSSTNNSLFDLENKLGKTFFVIALFIVSMLIIILGLVVVYSAVYNNADYDYMKQVIGVIVGIILMLLFWKFDYKFLADMLIPLIIINVVLILSPHLPIIGVTVKGAKSWIKIGTQIQPGEFAKITVILQAASVVARYGGKLDNLKEYIKTVGIMLIPVLCMMTQPDLGTSLVYLFIGAIALIAGGAKLKYLFVTMFLFILFFIGILFIDEIFKTVHENGQVEYHFLKNYQRQRLFVFLDPDSDTSGSGYNLKQAQIAIGSGGLFGKGLLNGTQAALKFLPEAPTDFIFCVLAEELGFVGVVVLLSLYAIFLFLCLRISRRAEDMFGKLLVVCCVAMWVFQILENIGMDCGLMPITGIPLPFISYGSSFMIVNCIMLGFIGSVAVNGISSNRRRKKYAFSGRHW